jgi:hypothetical protein
MPDIVRERLTVTTVALMVEKKYLVRIFKIRIAVRTPIF